jgi:hypothetical protein
MNWCPKSPLPLSLRVCVPTGFLYFLWKYGFPSAAVDAWHTDRQTIRPFWSKTRWYILPFGDIRDFPYYPIQWMLIYPGCSPWMFTTSVYHGCLQYAVLAYSTDGYIYHGCLLRSVYHGCLLHKHLSPCYDSTVLPLLHQAISSTVKNLNWSINSLISNCLKLK